MPGFPRLLHGVAQAYRDKPDDVARSAGEIVRRGLQQLEAHAPAAAPPRGADTVRRRARRSWRGPTTRSYGGIGQAPKFPNTAVFDLFLRAARAAAATRRATRDDAAHAAAHGARAASTTSSAAAFTATRSTSTGWCRTSRRCSTTTPSSCRSTCAAYQVTGDAFFARIARETLDYVAARDARSRRRLLLDPGRRQRGRGGQVLRLGRSARCCALLGEDVGELACRYWDVSARRQLRASQHPARDARRSSSSPRLYRRDAETVRADARRRARHAVRGARAARQAGARREDPHRVERPDDQRLRQGRRAASTTPATGRRRSTPSPSSSASCSAASGC